MTRPRSVWLAALLTVVARPASAHHSFAMFDHSKTVTLNGTVKDFQWTNPHCWIQLMVPQDDGHVVEWGVELDNPRSLVRVGWKPGAVKPGDKITLVIYPMRDGKTAGGYLSGIGADGQALSPRGK